MEKITRSDVIALIETVMKKRGITIPIGVSELSEDIIIKVLWDIFDFIEMIYSV